MDDIVALSEKQIAVISLVTSHESINKAFQSQEMPVTRKTFYNYLNENEEFRQAYLKAKREVKNQLLEQISNENLQIHLTALKEIKKRMPELDNKEIISLIGVTGKNESFQLLNQKKKVDSIVDNIKKRKKNEKKVNGRVIS